METSLRGFATCRYQPLSGRVPAIPDNPPLFFLLATRQTWLRWPGPPNLPCLESRNARILPRSRGADGHDGAPREHNSQGRANSIASDFHPMPQNVAPSPEFSRYRRWFEIAVQCLIFYSIASYYLEAELTEAQYIEPGHSFWQWNERVIAAFFSGEYLYRWLRAKHPLRYPFTPLALVDLLAILPFYIELAVDMRSLRLVRTLRILRLFKLYRYNAALQNVMRGFRKVKDELAVVGFVLVIMVMFSSVAIYEFEHESQPQMFARLSDAMWWSFVTLTTVGYGDIIPVTAGGRIIATITMAVGIGIFGTFISLIGSSFIDTMREQQRPSEEQRPHPRIRRAETVAPDESDDLWIESDAA
jgi:voltage-gated potassium channel